MCVCDRSFIHIPLHSKIYLRLLYRNIAFPTQLRILSFRENKGGKVKLLSALSVQMRLAAALEEEFEVCLEVLYLNSWDRQGYGQLVPGCK